METKSFNWLLFQLAHRQISVNILEVAFCRREKVLDWYCMNSNLQVHRNKVVAPSNLVRFMMSYFLSKRNPVLDEYRPEKFICYMYHKGGRKIINAKDAAEMVNNQMHGMEVITLHMALQGVDDSGVYRVSCSNLNNELHLEIESKKFEKERGTQIKDQSIADKIVTFIVNLCEQMGRFSKTLISMNLDLLLTPSQQIYLINIDDLTFQKETFTSSRDFQRVSNFKLSDGSSEDISEDDVQHNIIIPEKEPRKKDINKIRVPLSKPIVNNSPVFLEMIAKTIQKKRKIQYLNDYFDRKKFQTEDNQDLKKNSFHFNSRDTFKDLNLEKRLESLNDLLKYLEKTRPKNWIRDTTNLHKFSSLKPPSMRNLTLDKSLNAFEIENPNEKIELNKLKAFNHSKNRNIAKPTHHTLKLKTKKIIHLRSASDSKLPNLEHKYLKLI